jgi:hypothetical protein
VTALKGLNLSARGETPGHYDGKTKRTLKGFNPYRVAAGVTFCAYPRVAPLAVEFLPFREKQHKSAALFE